MGVDLEVQGARFFGALLCLMHRVGAELCSLAAAAAAASRRAKPLALEQACASRPLALARRAALGVDCGGGGGGLAEVTPTSERARRRLAPPGRAGSSERRPSLRAELAARRRRRAIRRPTSRRLFGRLRLGAQSRSRPKPPFECQLHASQPASPVSWLCAAGNKTGARPAAALTQRERERKMRRRRWHSLASCRLEPALAPPGQFASLALLPSLSV